MTMKKITEKVLSGPVAADSVCVKIYINTDRQSVRQADRQAGRQAASQTGDPLCSLPMMLPVFLSRA